MENGNLTHNIITEGLGYQHLIADENLAFPVSRIAAFCSEKLRFAHIKNP